MATKKDVRFCSAACRGNARSAPVRGRRLPVLHPNPDPLTWLPKKHPAMSGTMRRRPSWQLIVVGPCSECGEHFTGLASSFDTRPLVCSKRCERRRNRDQIQLARDRRRARKRDAFVENVYRRQIFDRDKWRCQLCGKATKRDAKVPHPKAPVLDHIVPLAVGGTHEPANVQCAHFLCNSIKSHGAANDQLRLIG